MDAFSSPQDESQPSTPIHRLPFRRQNSWTLREHTQNQQENLNDDNDGDLGEDRGSYGLGLTDVPGTSDSPKLKRVPVGSRDIAYTPSYYPTTPEIVSGGISQNTTVQNTPGDFLSPRTVSWGNISKTDSFHSASQPYRTSGSDTDLLLSNAVGSCPTQGDVLRGRWSWYSITIMTLAIYTTAFSTIFMVIAFLKPRWGVRVGTQGHLSFSSATLLSALFAKTIELSFVTVFVALLGQLLSRRAFTMSANTGGISIADMNMRTWIMQPGTLLANWTGVRYGATTLLGIIALSAAFCATFYTTAAEALVSPKLKMGPWEYRPLVGKVAAEYADFPYLEDKCQTPIQVTEDAANRGTTCLQIDFAGQGFHNFKTYLSTWTDAVNKGSISEEQSTSFAERPLPFALLYDNTTVQGQWLDFGNIEEDSHQFDRLVLNVTMAMPHANIFNAARDQINQILQPDDLEGNGQYSVQAAIPAPVLNVICAGISEKEANATFIGNGTQLPPDWPNAGVLDKVFNFTSLGEYPPLFGKLPQPFNTIVNFTNDFGPNSIYLLAGPPTDYIGSDDYVLCGMKSMQYSDCTTYYSAAESGGKLSVFCGNDPQNTMPYEKHQPNASPGGRWEKNWKDVGASWINSVALSQGITDGNASIARLVTQMIPPYNSSINTRLSTSNPTIGEALSVLAGNTLLASSESAPFVEFWNYTLPTLAQPQLQYFDAQLQFVDYASGASQNWQKMFYVILFATFLLNCFALSYLTWNFLAYGQVTDFTEPQNLFALAMNSPPSRNMAGACGGGPHGDVLGKKWTVNMHQAPNGNPNEHPHFFVRYQDEKDDYSPNLNRRSFENRFSSTMRSFRDHLSPNPNDNQSLYYRGRKTGRPRSIFETDGRVSPAVEQYQRLSGTEPQHM